MKQKIKHEIKLTPIEQLHAYSRNARTHSGEQVKRIAESIQEFGFLNPILVDSASRQIIAGHGRLLAARELGLETVPAVFFNHLTDVQRRAYTLADNKLALKAGWDEELLKLELDELKLEDFDLDVIGFEGFELTTAPQSNFLNTNENNEGSDDTFQPSLPKEDATREREKLTLIVYCEDEDAQQDLFDELKDRGFKVKI